MAHLLPAVNFAAIQVQAVRCVARSKVRRIPIASYVEIAEPLAEGRKQEIVRKAVEDVLRLVLQAVTEQQKDEIVAAVFAQDFDRLVDFTVACYVANMKDWEITPRLIYAVLDTRNLEVPADMLQSERIFLQGADIVYNSPPPFSGCKELKDEDGEMCIKYPNHINDYNQLVPPELRENHCAQTCNHHSCMSLRRDMHIECLEEMLRTPLPLIKEMIGTIMKCPGANLAGDKLRTLISLLYTAEILANDEYDWLRAWTLDRFGFACLLAKFLWCHLCGVSWWLKSGGNLNLKDLEEIVSKKTGELSICIDCNQRGIHTVYVTTRKMLVFDTVQNKSQFGFLLRYMDRFLPRQFALNDRNYALHTIQLIEWYGPIADEIDSHAFVVQVKGEDLLEICDGNPLTWPNKVLTEADLRTRNMRVQFAFFVEVP